MERDHPQSRPLRRSRARSPPIFWLWTRAGSRSNFALQRRRAWLPPPYRKQINQEQGLWRCGNPAYTRRIPTSPQPRLRLRLHHTNSNLTAIHRPILAFIGTVQRSLGSRCSPYRLFRGLPFTPNSILADDAQALFPQMDVWTGCCFGPTKQSISWMSPIYLI